MTSESWQASEHNPSFGLTFWAIFSAIFRRTFSDGLGRLWNVCPARRPFQDAAGRHRTALAALVVPRHSLAFRLDPVTALPRKSHKRLSRNGRDTRQVPCMANSRATVRARPAGRQADGPSLPQLLDIDGVAELLGVNVRHVRRLVAERRIPFVKWGHLLRFDPNDLAVWIDSARVDSRL